MGEVTAIKLTTEELKRLITLLADMPIEDPHFVDAQYLMGKLYHQLPDIDYIAEEALIAAGSGN